VVTAGGFSASHASFSLSFLYAQLKEQESPIISKRKQKEEQKQQLRRYANDEESAATSILNSFENDYQVLQSLNGSIDEYERSSKPTEHEKITAKVAKIVGQIESKKKQLKELQPKLNAVRRAVEDQDRYKTNLGANIDILEAQENVKVLEKEIAELEQKRDSVEGADTADDEYRAAKAKIESLKEKKARCDGLFSSYVEQIRALTVSPFCWRYVGYSSWEIAPLTIIFHS